MAVVGVSVLGIAVAGSVTATSNAQNTTAASSASPTKPVVEPSVSVAVVPGVAVPAAFNRRGLPVTQVSARPNLVVAAISRDVDRPDLELLPTDSRAEQTTADRALKLRETGLTKVAEATENYDASLKKARAQAKRAAAAARAAHERAERAQKAKRDEARKKRKAAEEDEGSGSGSASLPISSGYHIAARFGDTGSWSRYHTGIDFSVGMGTPVHAVAAGKVTHAGSGSAGWAGRYVTIRHADGMTSLYAHMSSVTVHEGEEVSGGQRVGKVGMTGRTFGPHVHFEIYPPGAKVGSPYDAINPAPWLRGRGLHY